MLLGGLRCLGGEIRRLLTPDWTSGIILILVAILFVPALSRHSADALLVASYFDDEALISQQLDGMTEWPFGNPAHYLDLAGGPEQLPERWTGFNYSNIPYYGGLYLDIALLFWAPAKLMGADILPHGLMILRALSLLSTMLMLLGGYNFAKQHFGRISGLVGMVFMAADFNLLSIGTVAHPDSLLFFLLIVALAIAVRHARDGGWTGVIALGLAAGLVQAAKMGGPLLVLMTVLAIAWGARSIWTGRGWLQWLWSCMLKGGLAVVLAGMVFVITTPYAVLDDYFFRTWALWAKQFTAQSLVQETTFWSWTTRIWENVGPVLILAAPFGFAALMFRGRTFTDRTPAILAAALGVWIFLYYALLQKYWVQLQYLAITYWVLAIFSGYLIDQAVALIPRVPRAVLAPVSSVFTVLAITGIFVDRILQSAGVPISYHIWSGTPQNSLGQWAAANLPAEKNSTLLYDFPLYVDAGQFTMVQTNGGPIRYIDLAEKLPDYIVLTRFASNWQTLRILDEPSPPWSEEFANVRLYQDVMGKGADPVVINTAAAPFLTFVHGVDGRMDSQALVKRWDCLKPELNPIEKYACLFEIVRYRSHDPRFVGLFKVNREAFIAQVPPDQLIKLATAFASSSVDGVPANILATGGAVWRSARQGQGAVGEFVGVSFPGPLAFRSLTIKWVSWSWCPTTFEVEGSDDGKTWASVASYAVKDPPDPQMLSAPGTMRWEETFVLPEGARYKSWRLRPTAMKEGNFFGLEQFRLQ